MARKLQTLILAVLAASLLCALFAAPASADRNFAIRWHETIQGDITSLGNTVPHLPGLLCKRSGRDRGKPQQQQLGDDQR